MGQGLAAPPRRRPLTPGVAVRRKDWAPWVKGLPPPPSHGPVAGSLSALRVLARCPSPAWPPPRCRRRYKGGGGGKAHTVPPSRLACAVAAGTSRGCPLVVPEAPAPHPPVPPARLAHGGPVRAAQGLHGASLPNPPRPGPLRRWWQGRLGVTAAGRLRRGAEAPRPASRAGYTSAASYGGKREGKGGAEAGASLIVLPAGRWAATTPPLPSTSTGAPDGSTALDGGARSRAPNVTHVDGVPGTARLPATSIAPSGRRGGGGPISPEPLRLSAPTAPPPPCRGACWIP